MHALLQHLAERGFDGAPRALGIDAQGREMLTFVPGSVLHPHGLDDAGLERVARLIRAYHTAVASFRPPADAHWQPDGRDPRGPAELICHNDLAPWNLVLGEPAWVFIDWDLAAPGRRLWDLALAACSFVPLWPDQPGGPRLERYQRFRAAYGLADADSRRLLEVVVERTQRMADVLLDNADREPYASLIRDGHAATWQRVAHSVEQQATRWRARLG